MGVGHHTCQWGVEIVPIMPIPEGVGRHAHSMRRGAGVSSDQRGYTGYCTY